MDCVYIIRVKVDCVISLLCKESFISKLNSFDSAHTVAVPKAADNSADYIVKSRAKTSASADSSSNVSRVKVNIFTRTCFFHELGFVIAIFFSTFINIHLAANIRIVCNISGAEISVLQRKFNRRLYLAFSQVFN